MGVAPRIFRLRAFSLKPYICFRYGVPFWPLAEKMQMPFRISRVVSLALFLILSGRVFAQTNWVTGNTGTFDLNTGTFDDHWSTATNWDAGVPTSGTLARIGFGTSPGTPGTALIDSTVSATASQVIVSNGAAGAGTLVMTGGDLTSAGTYDIGGNAASGAGANGTLLLSGGTITASAGSINVGYANANSGSLTAGIVNMSGGTIILSSNTQRFNIGVRGNATLNLSGGFINTNGGSLTTGLIGAQGTLNMSGGTILTGAGTLMGSDAGVAYQNFTGGNVNGASWILANNGATATGIVNGGSLNFGTRVVISRNSTSTGTLLVQSGVLKTGAIVQNNNAGTAGFLISGGQVLATSINFSSSTGTSVFSMSGGEFVVGNATYSDGSPGFPQLTLSGGTMTVGNFAENGSAWQFNAGTLSPGDSTQLGGGSAFGTTTFSASVPGDYNMGQNHHLHIDLGANPTSDPLTPNRDFVHLVIVTTNASHPELIGTVGNATLDGTIDVDITNPTYQALYNILTTDVATVGTGGQLNIGTHFNIVSHTPGWDFTYSIVDSGHTLQLEAIPEPSLIGIAGIGLMTLIHRRPRRRTTLKCA